VLLSIVVTAAHAADWRLLGPITQPQGLVYVDVSSMATQRTGHIVQGWFKLELTRPHRYGDRLMSKSVERQEANCEERTVRSLQALVYDRDDNLLDSRFVSRGKSTAVMPDTVSESIYLALCESLVADDKPSPHTRKPLPGRLLIPIGPLPPPAAPRLWMIAGHGERLDDPELCSGLRMSPSYVVPHRRRAAQLHHLAAAPSTPLRSGDRAPLPTANVSNLREARLRKPVLGPDEKPLPPYVIYDPPPPYVLTPCQVTSLPGSGSVSNS
jgi:hypothetical protein